MNDQGDLTPPPPPDPLGGAVPPAANPPIAAVSTDWWSRYRWLLIPAAGLGIVTAAAAGALLLLKPVTSVDRMVPASANVFVLANIDPSVSQKANLMRALHRFPDLKTDKAISDKLDEAFKSSGLSFSGDVQPWLGAQVGFSGHLSVKDAREMPLAVYLVSRDDAKAAAALARVRAGKWGSDYSWKEQAYNGVTISTGTPKSSGKQAVAYALVDHVVILAGSSSMIDEIIDTDQGRAARLVDSADYKATLKDLPSDRLASLYINGSSLVADLKKQLAQSSAVATPMIKEVQDVDAFRSVGLAVSANGDGILADLVVKFDQSKLSPATRQAMARPGHTDAVLKWIPRRSDAFLALGNLDQTITALVAQAGSDPSVRSTTDGIGLTGSDGILSHLTGDAGLELEVGTRLIPSGAILLGTDNAASMNRFLNKLVTFGTALGSGSTDLLTPGAKPSTTSFKTSVYRGVTITSYSGAGLGSAAAAFQPSYAVADRMGILGSNLAEVKAVIDAHQAGETIASDTTYQTALRAALKPPAGVLYVNVASLVDAVRRISSESGLAAVDRKALDNLGPVKSVMLTATSQAGVMMERIFIVIQ